MKPSRLALWLQWCKIVQCVERVHSNGIHNLLCLGSTQAGNVLLSFEILMAGASVSKVMLVFKHMGLCSTTCRTFFLHQKRFLFPVILYHWEVYREGLIRKVKGMKDIVWSGDGRFDSMEHSAKYGTYSMFCFPIDKIVHFELLQVISNYRLKNVKLKKKE